MTNKLAIIGGSGLYDVEESKNRELLDINTPWGNPSDQILKTKFNEKEVFFLPRHGRGHFVSPSKINFRANIDALKQLGVTDIVSVSAVGSLKEELNPGKFVIVDQFIDRTINRKKSFFDEGIVAYVPMAKPVSQVLMDASKKILSNLNYPYSYGGTYLAMEGPQFSTYAESNLYRKINCDVIGMTNMPEAKLAREAEICYTTLACVTDYDVWRETHGSVTVDMVLANLQDNIAVAQKLIRQLVTQLPSRRECPCATAAVNAVVTSPEVMTQAAKDYLELISGNRVN